jgi:radical SAM superfamily enzyme YgiQ (UPF0313 family)
LKIVFVCAEDEIPGVSALSGYMKAHGHEADLIFDPRQFSRAYIQSNFLSKLFSREEENLQRLEEMKPNLIAFSVVTAHYQWALRFAKKIKVEFPDIPIIFGGAHPTVVPEVVIKEDYIDYVCVGEGEEALLELVESLEKGDGNPEIRNIWFKNDDGVAQSNPLRPLVANLDELPFVDKELFYKQLPSEYKNNTYFFTSRGCPFGCTYCCNAELMQLFRGLGKYIRQMSVKRTINELIDIKRKYKPKTFLFEDDVFTANKEWTKQFLSEYSEKVGIPFTCSGHTRFLSDEIIIRLKEAGCKMLWFGIQSASEKMRKDVLNRFERNDSMIKVADLCHKSGLRFMVDHILNLPYDTDENIKEALRLYNTMRPCVINVYPLLYFPKSPIINSSIEYGQLRPEDVDNINQGKTLLYQGGRLRYRKKDSYRKYALLLTCIPILPKSWVNKIEKSDRLINFFSRLPISLITPIKLILYYRAGYGFLPLGILKIEFSFTKQLLAKKIKKSLGLGRKKEDVSAERVKKEVKQHHPKMRTH